ncbi:MAG: hypothetical protein LCH53_06005 [Bacteroidetes bacterium]|nr:hypothetical protein [Bacteroidota bacterium]
MAETLTPTEERVPYKTTVVDVSGTGVVRAVERLRPEPSDILILRTQAFVSVGETALMCALVKGWLEERGLHDVLVLIVPEASGITLAQLAKTARDTVEAQLPPSYDRLHAAVRCMARLRGLAAEDARDGHDYDLRAYLDAARDVARLAKEIWPDLAPST